MFAGFGGLAGCIGGSVMGVMVWACDMKMENSRLKKELENLEKSESDDSGYDTEDDLIQFMH